MSDYIKGYTDALTGAGWMASVDPAALLESDLVGFEPLSIREHRRKYDAAVAARAIERAEDMALAAELVKRGILKVVLTLDSIEREGGAS